MKEGMKGGVLISYINSCHNCLCTQACPPHPPALTSLLQAVHGEGVGGSDVVVDGDADPLAAPADEAGLAVYLDPHHLRQSVSTGVGGDVPYRDLAVWRKAIEEGHGEGEGGEWGEGLC